jgi:pre-rRNA-processing protein TSR1
MSSYQADWFQDEDGNVDFDASVIDRQPGDEDEEQAPLEQGAEEDEGEDRDLLHEEDDDDMSVVDAQRNASAKQMMRAALAQDEKEFPDEMQTPSDMSARLRFARYRALQSFRASPWHPKENLPQDYAGIFEFENFNGTQRRCN